MKLPFKRCSVGVWIGFITIAFILLQLRNWLKRMEPNGRLHFEIKTTWNDHPIDHASIHLNLFSDLERGLVVEVDAPFFNDPPNPGGLPGQPFQGLWEFEVVEVFFLNDKNQYLEVEFCPHGQHLVLLLSDYRTPFKDMLNLTYNAVIDGKSWKGKAVIPWKYFPQDVTKFNAYAIHGSATWKVYETLFPVPKEKYSTPDFHRLEYFQKVDFGKIIPKTSATSQLSDLWKHLS